MATELTVLKIAKSKIPGVLGVGCGSGEGRRIRKNMECKVPSGESRGKKYGRQVRYLIPAYMIPVLVIAYSRQPSGTVSNELPAF